MAIASIMLIKGTDTTTYADYELDSTSCFTAQDVVNDYNDLKKKLSTGDTIQLWLDGVMYKEFKA